MLTKDEDLIDLEMLASLLNKYHCMPLSILDGFLVAIVSLDRVVLPSEWYKHVGINKIEFESEADAKIFIPLLMDFYNSIIHELLEQSYEPLLMEDSEENLQMSAKAWANGYTFGVAFDGPEWFEDLPEDYFTLLMTVFAFTLPEKEAHARLQELYEEKLSKTQVKDLFRDIPNYLGVLANNIYQYQLGKRSQEVKHASSCDCPHHAVKVGRNDPCPCGSGKKYKKCCLH